MSPGKDHRYFDPPTETWDLPTKDTPNLALFFDGTGDWAGSDSTNVLKIFQHVEKSDRQLAYYDGGVGTLNNPNEMTATGRTVMRTLDLALATGMRDVVLNGYRFLVRNYRPGSRIYLFGFSRGSYTARVLASMIKEFGLLTLDNEHMALYLWQTISDVKARAQFQETAETLRRDFSRPGVEVFFMGLFDTVSSVGILSRFKVFPSADGNDMMNHVRHAVSIGEQRNVFPECLFDPGPCKCKDLLEIWFPGVHRDVGGGYKAEESLLPNQPLLWIAREARAHGLAVEIDAIEMLAKDGVKPASGGGIDPYVPGGIYPMLMEDRRLPSGNNPFQRYRYLWPNLKHIRPIPIGANIWEDIQKQVGKTDWSLSDIEPHVKKADKPNQYAEPEALPELAGIVLGSGVLALLVHSLCGWPFGRLWDGPIPLNSTFNPESFIDFVKLIPSNPHAQSIFIWFLFGVYAALLLPSKATQIGEKPNRTLPAIGLLLGGVYLAVGVIDAVKYGLIAGALIAACCLYGMSETKPSLCAVRALPFAATAWLGTAFAFFTLSWPKTAVHWIWQSVSYWIIGAVAVVVALLIGWIYFIPMLSKSPKSRPSNSVKSTAELTDAEKHRHAIQESRTKKNNIRWVFLGVYIAVWIAYTLLKPDAHSLNQSIWLAIADSTLIAAALCLKDRKLLAEGAPSTTKSEPADRPDATSAAPVSH